jgi:hypothetical protein
LLAQNKSLENIFGMITSKNQSCNCSGSVQFHECIYDILQCHLTCSNTHRPLRNIDWNCANHVQSNKTIKNHHVLFIAQLTIVGYCSFFRLVFMVILIDFSNLFSFALAVTISLVGFVYTDHSETNVSFKSNVCLF